MTSKADKLPLEMEPVARDNNTSWTLKSGHHTIVAPYSAAFLIVMTLSVDF